MSGYGAVACNPNSARSESGDQAESHATEPAPPAAACAEVDLGEKVDKAKVSVLNSVGGDASFLFHVSNKSVCRSDVDAEMILYVPFLEQVKLQSIIMEAPDGEEPTAIKFFVVRARSPCSPPSRPLCNARSPVIAACTPAPPCSPLLDDGAPMDDVQNRPSLGFSDVDDGCTEVRWRREAVCLAPTSARPTARSPTAAARPAA